MDRKNQPLWLRLLNATSVVAILLFVFIYQAKLTEWPAYLLVLATICGAGVNFVIHIKDAIAARAAPEKVAENASEGKEEQL